MEIVTPTPRNRYWVRPAKPDRLGIATVYEVCDRDEAERIIKTYRDIGMARRMSVALNWEHINGEKRKARL